MFFIFFLALRREKVSESYQTLSVIFCLLLVHEVIQTVFMVLH